jgi:hypothetical protein
LPDGEEAERHGHASGDGRDEAILATPDPVLPDKIEDKLVRQLAEDAGASGLRLGLAEVPWSQCNEFLHIFRRKKTISPNLFIITLIPCSQ